MKPKQHPPIIKQITLGFRMFWRALPQIAAFELLFRLLTSLLVKPLLGFTMQFLLDVGGYNYVFNEQIFKFFLSAPGIIAAFLLCMLATLTVYFEFAVIINLARQTMHGIEKEYDEETGKRMKRRDRPKRKRPNLALAIKHGIWAFKTVRGPGVLLLFVYSLLLLPFVNLGVTSSLLPEIQIPNFITGEIAKMPLGAVLLLAGVALVLVVFFLLLFVLPAMVLEHKGFIKCVKRSLRAIRIYGLNMVGCMAVFITFCVLMFYLPRAAFIDVYGVPNVGILQVITTFGFSLRMPVAVLVWLLSYAVQLALMPLLMFMLTAAYAPVGQLAEIDDEAATRMSGKLSNAIVAVTSLALYIVQGITGLLSRVWNTGFIKKHRKLVVAVGVVIAGLVAYNAFATVMVHDPIIIGHRGSAYAVENTIPAIQGAIDAGADYAEVDVLLSADGVPMVVHDANLKRLSGADVNVYDLTAKQLGGLQLEQNGSTGSIPTLQQVIDYCDGKILLAIELKTHGHEQEDLVDSVMRIVKENDYQRNCMFLSLDYELVAALKQRFPSYRAGYCVYGNIGRMNTSTLAGMDIDFLLVEEWMISKSLVNKCKKAWLPVYVWTVNDSAKMEDYLGMGAVGLITDYPDTGMETLGSIMDIGGRNLFVIE